MSLSLAGAQELIAASATFQSWTGSANAEEAKTRVYLPGVPTDEATRPFACLLGAEWKATREAITTFCHSAGIGVLVEADVAAEHKDSFSDAYLAFVNKLGQVRDDMLEKAATFAALRVGDIEVSQDSIKRSIWEEDAGDGDYFNGVMVIRVE